MSATLAEPVSLAPVAPKTDRELQDAVINELRWDSRVDSEDIGVSVTNGVVALTGHVDCYAKKLAAIAAAHRVAGVLDVANDIEVMYSSAPKPDEQIAQAIRSSLAWDVFVPEKAIRSTVSKGWVTLEGDVPLWRNRTDAERAIRNLNGVRGVTNQITVTPEASTPAMADKATVAQVIEKALTRQALLEAHNIGVDVHNGTVTLTGKIPTWREKMAITEVVGNTPGVRMVDNCLQVSSCA